MTDAMHCRLCGKSLEDEPAYQAEGLCGDCYWDDQTDSTGAVGGADEDDDD